MSRAVRDNPISRGMGASTGRSIMTIARSISAAESSRAWPRQLAAAALLLTCTAALHAQPVIFVTQDQTLIRVWGSNIDVFDVGIPPNWRGMAALEFDETGVLWVANTDVDQDRRQEIWRIRDPFGTPVAELVSDGLPENTPTIEWIDGQLYGVERSQTLVRIDPATGATQPVGSTGATGLTVFAGMGFSSCSRQLYALSASTDSLYSVDWELAHGPNPQATLIGPTGLSEQDYWHGMTYSDHTDTLYAAVKHNDDRLNIYTLNTQTGQATFLLDLSAATAVRGQTGIAVADFVPPIGDLTGDGCVELDDLGILLADFGCTGGVCPGDVDGDGDTDLADLGILLSNFGTGPGCPACL
jgi:hypothetical protein